MATLYERKNAIFSLAAHEQAKAIIYPKIWPGGRLEISHTDGTERDMEDKVDVEIKIFKPELTEPLLITVQERWRRVKFSFNRDVTITEYNNATNTPVEFYVGSMDYILYGYFDKSTGEFGEVVLVNVPKLRTLIANDAISYSTKLNEKQQSFKAFKFNSLSQSGALDWYSTPSIAAGEMAVEYWRMLYLDKIKKA